MHAKLAASIKQAIHHQQPQYFLPTHPFPALRQPLLPKLVQPQLLPQLAGQPAVAGIDDLALMIREKAPEKGKKDSEKGEKAEAENDKEDSSPPQAVLLFLGDKSGTFAFWKLGPHHFLDAFPNFTEDGGIGVFKIEKGVLIINSSISVSMGSWAAG